MKPDRFPLGFICGIAMAALGYLAWANKSDWDDNLGLPPEPSVADYVSLPVEAFGYNWRIVRFRKDVYFPSNFGIAFQRALEVDKTLGEMGIKSSVVFSHRIYRFKGLIPITANTTIRANGATLAQ